MDTCVRCQARGKPCTWIRRTVEQPKRCPKCGSPYWWRPARIAKVRIVGPVGAPVKYPIQGLEVGYKITIPWPKLPNGVIDSKKLSSIHSAISSYGRRSGKKFKHNEGSGSGLTVVRLA